MEVIESILSRARTYQVPKWRYQSHKLLNPYTLSSQGYLAIQQGVMQCQVCKHQVILSEQDQQNSQQLQQQLKHHEQNCIYKEKCEQITKEKMYMAMQDLLLVIETQSIKPNRFPLINTTKLQQFIKTNSLVFRKVLALYQIDYNRFKISLILQIMGWHFIKNAQQEECLSCYFCGRQISLSNFQLSSDDKQENKSQVAADQLFDPINEHRYFCLWIGKEEGWLTFLQHMEDKFLQIGSFRFKTPTLETKRLRVHIQKFIEGFKDKIENAITKLKGATQQAGNICEKLGEDPSLAISAEQSIRDMKRLRDNDHDLQELKLSVQVNLKHPFKKIMLN